MKTILFVRPFTGRKKGRKKTKTREKKKKKERKRLSSLPPSSLPPISSLLRGVRVAPIHRPGAKKKKTSKAVSSFTSSISSLSSSLFETEYKLRGLPNHNEEQKQLLSPSFKKEKERKKTRETRKKKERPEPSFLRFQTSRRRFLK